MGEKMYKRIGWCDRGYKGIQAEERSSTLILINKKLEDPIMKHVQTLLLSTLSGLGF